jgi:DNA-binding PucR family transcriptional regulator
MSPPSETPAPAVPAAPVLARPVLPADALHATVAGLACAVLAGPARELRTSLDGRAAGIGPAVALADAARSFRLACAALALAEDRGVQAPLAADAHRVALLWRAEPALVAELAAERLAPLAGETANSHARLEATLLAWLRHAGTIAAVAAELDVHPQTVRYRLGRLRELFGADLDEPDARFELELVLRARAA